MAKRERWLKVTTTDAYGRWETLGQNQGDGFLNDDLIPNTRIRVKWPDGSTSLETVIVQQGTDTLQIDMNNCPDQFRTQTLFVHVHGPHGVRTVYPLARLRFQRLT